MNTRCNCKDTQEMTEQLNMIAEELKKLNEFLVKRKQKEEENKRLEYEIGEKFKECWAKSDLVAINYALELSRKRYGLHPWNIPL